jgi:hypothetical protein
MGLTYLFLSLSHPTFKPEPSLTDIINQGNLQRTFADEDCPFVGLINGALDGLSQIFFSLASSCPLSFYPRSVAFSNPTRA